ncbi:hypothetical protein TEA_028602 [Camellia sinensis var. sinensis]|uniref:Aminotransferase class I/classII large domain-containing protein n=1 Tax=Camellia sinensis var. sinensis TaxID=542762 RepID=A0A4S4ERD6_CAMSN|nr:hypothetical protein TEA_028602 [Camellia sinensis var. sinensis]
MEEEEEQSTKWRFKGSEELIKASAFTIKGVVSMLSKNLSEDDNRPVIRLGHGDPSASRCFLTTPIAEDAIVEAVRPAQFNSYAPNVGILPARRSVAEYLSRDLPYKLSPDDVYLTVGTKHAIQIILPVLAYPEKGWEVDLDGLRALANDKTVAMVIINPGNPCCNVFTYEHLQKVAETARELGILVIADEVYGHLAFGNTQFVPMGVSASTVPIVTLGSISKRWIVPGWRLGQVVARGDSGFELVKKH